MGNLPTSTILIILAIIAPFLILQAAWIFRDARKRGEKYYWLWGLFGLMNVPQSLLIYLIVTRVIVDRIKDKK
ncbi:MAG: hypothetical protein Q8930_16770, partial [Bacillota bacterium]|nr:hypothetical protein [Bacillota bacterium]